MFKKLIFLIVPAAVLSLGFAEQAAMKPLPEDLPIEDNYYDPDKTIDGPIPHPRDVQ